MCPTFGRPQLLLEETIFSFLNQDYPGPKELVLLNDFDQVTIHFNHPEVRVINLPVRFRTLGEKRNALAAMCRHDLLAVWDDDDIYLPHRLTYSIRMFDSERRFFKPSAAFLLDGGIIGGPVTNLFHGGALWHRSLFNDAGGYRRLNSGEDMQLEIEFERLIGSNKNHDAITPSEIFYLYRWNGTDSYHLSGFGEDSTGETATHKILDYVTRELRRGRIPTGTMELRARWRLDYAALIRDYLAA